MSDLKIHVEDTEAVFRRARDIAKRIDAGERDMQEFHYSFDTMELFLKTLTSNRWTLLGALKRRGPSSIRALASMIGRDYKAVHTDVTALIAAGLIERNEKGMISVHWTKISAEMSDVAAA